MGLIYVEAAASHAANHDWATPHSSALSAGTTTKTAEAFPLHAVAKFLDAILKILLVAAAEILGAALRATDADGFGGAFCACAVQRQRRDVTKVLRRSGRAVATEAGVASGERRQRAIEGEALEAPACGDAGVIGFVGLLLLARSQYQLGVDFA